MQHDNTGKALWYLVHKANAIPLLKYTGKDPN